VSQHLRMIEQEMSHQAERIIADRKLGKLRRVKFALVTSKGDCVRHKLTELLIQYRVNGQCVTDLILCDGGKRDVFFEDRSESCPLAIAMTDHEFIVGHSI